MAITAGITMSLDGDGVDPTLRLEPTRVRQSRFATHITYRVLR